MFALPLLTLLAAQTPAPPAEKGPPPAATDDGAAVDDDRSPVVDLAAPENLDPGYQDGDLVEQDGELFLFEDGKLVPFDTEDVDDKLYTEVTGSRVDTKKNPVVRTDTVTSEDLQEMGARDLGDVLKRSAGLQVSTPTGTGQNVSIDGLDSKYVLILIDGRRVNGQTNDRVDISRLPIVASDIERIEVVRGPMSALYGSEAMGGVVNIITKRPQSGLHADVGYFTRLLPTQVLNHGLQLSSTGGLPGLNYRLSATGTLQDGVDRMGRSINNVVVRRPDGALDLPYKRQATVQGEVSFYPIDAFVIRTYGRGTWSELETRMSQANARSDHTLDLQLQFGSMMELDITEDHHVTLDVRLDRYSHTFDRIPLGSANKVVPFCEDKDADTLTWRVFDPACPNPPQVTSTALQDDARIDARYTGELFRNLPLVHRLRLSAGMLAVQQSWDRRDGDGNDTLPGNIGRRQLATYGEVLYQPFEWWSMLPGIRFDLVHPGAGDNALAWGLGPKFATRFQLPLGLSLRGSYGQGFRMPSFTEQFLFFDHREVGYTVNGNPDLEPEYSHGFRGEIMWDSALLSVGAEGFVNLLNNAIQFDYIGVDDSGFPLYTYVNVDRAATAGLNLRASIPETYGASASVTYQWLPIANNASACPDENPYLCDETDGAQRLILQPEHSANFNVRYRFAPTDTTLFSQATLSSNRYDRDTTDNDILVPGYFLLRAGVTQRVLEHAELTIAAENILDVYGPVYGPKPGRTVSANLRAFF